MAFHQEKRVVLEEFELGTEWSQLSGSGARVGEDWQVRLEKESGPDGVGS